MSPAETFKAFYDETQVQSDLRRVLPAPGDPLFVDNFMVMAQVLAGYLLSQREDPDKPVPYEDLIRDMDLNTLLERVGDHQTPDQIRNAIQSYIECIRRCSWADIEQAGMPKVAWMNHNFCYGSLLEPARR